MPLIDHFSLLAPFYEKAIPLRQPDQIIKRLKLTESTILLDAGGGTGRVAQAMVGKAGLIIVSDESFTMLQHARKKASLHAAVGRIEYLPFPANSIDQIIIIDAFHHLQNQQSSAQELWRVLKPGGRLLIEEPDIRKFSVKIVAIAEKLALMRSHFMAPDDISGLFPPDYSKIMIEVDGFNAWVIVDKLDPGIEG